MKPRFKIVEENTEEHQRLLKFVREHPERTAYLLALLLEVHERLKQDLQWGDFMELEELSHQFRYMRQELQGINTAKQLAHWVNQNPKLAEKLIVILMEMALKMGEEVGT